jgi:hypothetical protein
MNNIFKKPATAHGKTFCTYSRIVEKLKTGLCLIIKNHHITAVKCPTQRDSIYYRERAAMGTNPTFKI